MTSSVAPVASDSFAKQEKRPPSTRLTATLSREFPDMRIIGLSMHEREDMANAMRAAGASAYLTKSGPSDLLLGILRTFVAPPVVK